jgi:hypothetical protein
MSSDSTVFDDLPKFDSSKFQPPAWASGPAFNFAEKNGESSKSQEVRRSDANLGDQTHTPTLKPPGGSHRLRDDGNEDGTEDEDEEEVWEDAQDDLDAGIEETPDGLAFTISELQVGSLALPFPFPERELTLRNFSLELKHLKSKAMLPSPPNRPTHN